MAMQTRRNVLAKRLTQLVKLYASSFAEVPQTQGLCLVKDL